MKDKLKVKLVPKLPIITMSTAATLSLYFMLKAVINYLFLIVGQFTGEIPSFFLFGDSLHPGLLGFSLATIFLILSWLGSTKFIQFQSPKWRFVWFWNMFVGILFYYLWLITAPVYNTILPYLGLRINQLTKESIWTTIAIGDTNTLLITIMFIPTIVTISLVFWLAGQYSQYANDIKEAFSKFEFRNVWLQKYFKLQQKEHWPDVVLGPQSDTKELLIQPGRDRTLNNIIIGSIGTGKTAALVLPILNQDLHWMTRFINDYPEIYQREDYDTEKVKGMYLNGITVIEPSNDLCQKALKLVKAHGIPEESVFYIDPTNVNTPSINPMQGPVDQVAEAFAMVIEGLAEGQGADFFRQSERNHLKHYIYLLKLHDPDQDVTFDMLLNMYNNPQLVRKMHEKLKERVPKNLEDIKDRDERNHWAIVKQIDEWFDMNLLPKTNRKNGETVAEKVTHGEFRGQEVYYDAKEEYVQGLRNVLNDIGANPLIRRVLFGKSDFDFDKHLESGGVLLVNTAKGEMAGLSNILGKLILLSIQNAVFRRKPNVSTFHSLIVDEFPDYVYAPFKEFPAQSRKYKTIVTVVAQTVAQLADKYGETYMHTLLGTLRHKMVYGDIPDFDAQLFSKMFGEKERFEESVNEQAVSPLQEKPMLRMGNSYQKTKDAILSPSDIIYQKPFQCAVKIVVNNEPIPVKQIDANFVPNEEFDQAVITVTDEAAEIWLESRNRIITKTPLVEEGIEEVIEDLPKEDYKLLEQKMLNIPKHGRPVDLIIEKPHDEVEDVLASTESKAVPFVVPMSDYEESTSHHDGQLEEGEEDSDKTVPPVSANDQTSEPPMDESMSKEAGSQDEVSTKPTKSDLGPKQNDLISEIEKGIKEVAATQSTNSDTHASTTVPMPFSFTVEFNEEKQE